MSLSRIRQALVIAMCWSSLAIGAGPTAAAGPGVATMSAGDDHTCAVRTDGTIWCWGYAREGQLGDGTGGDDDQMRTSPVRVHRGSSVLRDMVKVAAGGSHTCAVRDDGRVLCWGYDGSGQLGDGHHGSDLRRYSAVFVRRGSGHLTGVKAVTAGGEHTCALRSNGTVVCWGYAEFGALGDGTTGDTNHVRTKAVGVRRGSGYLDRVVAIAAGDRHTCALRRDRSVWCWGEGSWGQLGDGKSGMGHHRTKATRVRRGSGYLTKASGIAAGSNHTCARRTDGTAWCWGSAEYGQLGDGTVGGSDLLTATPTQVRRGSGVLTGVTGIGAGADHTCARRSDGSAWCWGLAGEGQIGDGSTGDPATHLRLKAVRVVRSSNAFTGLRKLDGGTYHTCALRADRTVWCWGTNGLGQAGRGSRDDDPHPYPRKVTFP